MEVDKAKGPAEVSNRSKRRKSRPRTGSEGHDKKSGARGSLPRPSLGDSERKRRPILSSGVRKITSLSEARQFISTLDTGDIFLHKSTGAFACCTRMAFNTECVLVPSGLGRSSELWL